MYCRRYECTRETLLKFKEQMFPKEQAKDQTTSPFTTLVNAVVQAANEVRHVEH